MPNLKSTLGDRENMVAAIHTNPDRLLVDGREAARLLCVSESTLTRLTRSGSLPVVQIGRSVRFAPADLQAWVEARKTGQVGCLA
jgi:excisionase family DNA binding protein